MIKKILTISTLFTINSSFCGPFGLTARHLLSRALTEKAIATVSKQESLVVRLAHLKRGCNIAPRCAYGMPCACAELMARMDYNQILEAQRIASDNDHGTFNID